MFLGSLNRPDPNLIWLERKGGEGKEGSWAPFQAPFEAGRRRVGALNMEESAIDCRLPSLIAKFPRNSYRSRSGSGQISFPIQEP